MTALPSGPRQTLSYLRDLFEARGIHPKNKLGQSFLIDLNLVDVILRVADLTAEDLVVEVGSGTGSLTARLSEKARAVVSVEVDPAFYALACEVLADRKNVLFLRADVLAGKNELDPEVLREIAEVQQRSGSARLKLVANLPYAVATPVISNFLLSDFRFERMVVMVQSEIAERLLAKPSTKEYGALAVLVQSLADVDAIRRRVPPEVFWPRPRVASAIVCIRPSVKKRSQVGDVLRFRRFLRDLYTHRRKNLRGALSSTPNGRREKVEIDRKLAELGLDGTCRAEGLDVEQHLRLCEVFKKD